MPEPAPDVLYAGPDLEHAAARSKVHGSPQNRLVGARNAAGVLGDVLRYRLADRRRGRLELVTASGHTPASPRLAAAYLGYGANLAWCLSTVFSNHEETGRRSIASPREAGPALRDAARGASFVFTDGIDRPVWTDAGSELVRMPAWIRQRLRVLPDWSAQLAAMRRGTRRETARILRRHGYECRLTRAPTDVADFYELLYRPHVTRRFGRTALVVGYERFARECARGVVLQLRRQGALEGAVLLRRLGNRLALLWSATAAEPEAGAPRGAADAMDYFSLLYAHLTRCRWLDFGTSRPDLLDGALRYKAKWGARVTPGFVPQAALGWTCTGGGPAERAVLSRHAFLCRGRSGLRANVFVGDGMSEGAVHALIDGLRTPGVAEYRLITLAPSAALGACSGLAGIRCVAAGSVAEAMRAAAAP